MASFIYPFPLNFFPRPSLRRFFLPFLSPSSSLLVCSASERSITQAHSITKQCNLAHIERNVLHLEKLHSRFRKISKIRYFWQYCQDRLLA